MKGGGCCNSDVWRQSSWHLLALFVTVYDEDRPINVHGQALLKTAARLGPTTTVASTTTTTTTRPLATTSTTSTTAPSKKTSTATKKTSTTTPPKANASKVSTLPALGAVAHDHDPADPCAGHDDDATPCDGDNSTRHDNDDAAGHDDDGAADDRSTRHHDDDCPAGHDHHHGPPRPLIDGAPDSAAPERRRA